MRDERILRVAEAARRAGADWALLTSADAVCYATQHVGIIETGQSPFAGGPSLAFVSSDASTVALLVNNLEESDATHAPTRSSPTLGSRWTSDRRSRTATKRRSRTLFTASTLAESSQSRRRHSLSLLLLRSPNGEQRPSLSIASSIERA